MFWVFLIIVILVVLACWITYREAEVHELHKIRAAFEDRKVDMGVKIGGATAEEKERLLARLKEIEELEKIVDDEERKIHH